MAYKDAVEFPRRWGDRGVAAASKLIWRLDINSSMKWWTSVEGFVMWTLQEMKRGAASATRRGALPHLASTNRRVAMLGLGLAVQRPALKTKKLVGEEP